jgi:hypothetical protein
MFFFLLINNSSSLNNFLILIELFHLKEEILKKQNVLECIMFNKIFTVSIFKSSTIAKRKHFSIPFSKTRLSSLDFYGNH